MALGQGLENVGRKDTGGTGSGADWAGAAPNAPAAGLPVWLSWGRTPGRAEGRLPSLSRLTAGPPVSRDREASQRGNIPGQWARPTGVQRAQRPRLPHWDPNPLSPEAVSVWSRPQSRVLGPCSQAVQTSAAPISAKSRSAPSCLWLLPESLLGFLAAGARGRSGPETSLVAFIISPLDLLSCTEARRAWETLGGPRDPTLVEAWLPAPCPGLVHIQAGLPSLRLTLPVHDLRVGL